MILEAALRISSRHGLEGLTIGELAKAVGMSKSGLFAHFESKDALQLEVLKEATARFIDKVMRPAFHERAGEARVQALFDNWFEYLNDESLPGGSILIAASTELDDRPGSLRDFVQDSQKDLIRNIEKAAKISIETGEFKKDLDIEHFAWSLYSLVLGLPPLQEIARRAQGGAVFEKVLCGLAQLLAREWQNAHRSLKNKKFVYVKQKILKCIQGGSNGNLESSMGSVQWGRATLTTSSGPVLLTIALGFTGAPFVLWTLLGFAVVLIGFGAPVWLLAIVASSWRSSVTSSRCARPSLSGPLMRFMTKMKFLPAISDTEMQAITAGTTWMEAEALLRQARFQER